MPWSPAPRPCRSAGSAGAVAASTRRSAARAGGGTPGAGPGASPRRAPPPLAERAAGLLGRLVRPAMLQVRPLLLGAHLGALERVLANGLRLGARVRAAHHLLLGQQLRTGAQLLAVVRRFLPRPTAGLLVTHGPLLPPRPGRYHDGETARACLSCGVNPADVAVLLGAGVVAGVVSTVVSFASLVSYPALLAVGLPPVAANVTNTVALVFTAVGAAAGSRPELAGQGGRVLRLGVVTAGGGAAGAALLLLSRAFEAVAPWLIAGSSLLLLAQPRVTPPGAGGGRRR